MLVRNLSERGNDAPEENKVSNQNESDSNSDNERSEIPAAVNTQEPNLDELLDGQVQSEEQVQPVDEPPPLPPTRRSTRVRSAPNPLTYNQLGNPERFVSSVKATSTFQPVVQPPWFPPWTFPFHQSFYPLTNYQCPCCLTFITSC